MKRGMILRLLSCFLAGILLLEAPIQVYAAGLDGSVEQAGDVDGSEDISETEPADAPKTDADADVSDAEPVDENAQKTDEDGNTQEPASPNGDTLPTDVLGGDGKETDVPPEKSEKDKQREETAPKTEDEPAVPGTPFGEEGDGAENDPLPEPDDGKQEDNSGAVSGPDTDTDKKPSDQPEEPASAETQTAWLTLTGARYGSRPEYSDEFDAEAAGTLLSDLSEALAEDEADISGYAVSLEMLPDVLTWIVNHEEAYNTVLPYVEYTYIEKEDVQEIQTVRLSRVPEEELLSLSAVRSAEDVKLSFVPSEGIEQYRAFRVSADEVTELSKEEGQDLFIDKTAFEEQSACQYVICGYQTVEEELRLCAFSDFVSGEYELMPPENLETEPGEGTVTLTWDAVELASGYEVEVSDQEDGEFVLIGQAEGTEYKQEQLEDGAEHFYRVRAFGSDADESLLYSDYSRVESGKAAPAAPKLESDISGNTVTLKWKAVTGADGYILYQYIDGEYRQIGDFIKDKVSEELEYIISGMKFNESRKYAVSAFVNNDDTGQTYTEGNKSDVVEIIIGFGKIELTASSSKYNAVNLSWTESFGADGYEIERNGWEDPVKIESGKTHAYKDGSVTAGTSYTYRVRPYQIKEKDKNGKPIQFSYGEWSASKSIKPVLPAVKIDSVAKVDYQALKLTWKKGTDATGYQVYRSTSKTGNYDRIKVITSGSTLSYQDSKRVPGVTYYYKIRAYHSEEGKTTVYSDYSPIVSGTTALNKVSGVKAASSAYNAIKLTWSKVPGATGYVIERSENGSVYKRIKTITSGSTLTYTNSSLGFNKKYSYRIRAFYKKSDGKYTYGAYSSAASATTKLPATKIKSVVSVNYNTVKITWNKVTGAGGYKVYRATSANGKYSAVATIKSGNTVTYQNTGLTMDKTYYYKVCPYRVVNGKEVYGTASGAVKGIPKLSAVTKPKAVSASYNAVKVSWAKTAGASGYVVYYSASKNSGYKTLKTVTGTSYTHSGLTTGKTYYYKVRPYRTVSGKKVYGGYSSVVSAKPVPGKVSAKRSSVTYNSVKLTWARVSGAGGYDVYRSGSKNGTYSRVTTLTSGSTLSYTNINLTTGKTYYYKVRAYRIVNGKKICGSFSTVVSGKPGLKTPMLKRSTMTYNSAKLTWNKIAGASGYEIYRSTSKNGTYEYLKRMTSGSSVAYTDSSLTTGKTYYYKIRAYRMINGKRVYGAFSALVSGKPVLGKVSKLKAVPTGNDKGSIKLTWSKVNGATGYVISRSTSKDGTYKTVKTIDSGGTLSWTNTGLVLGQKYYYKICATRGSYKSGTAGPAQAMASIMELSDSSLSLTVGNSQKVAVVTLPKVTVSWSTSDKNVATVDSSGKITAVGAGKAKIYAKANGLTRSISVTVKGKTTGTGSGNYKGIDVSSHQGSINWRRVANDGIDFAMIRVTCGSDPRNTTKDEYFEDNYNGARDNDIKVGVYRYSYAGSRTEARCEAEAVLKALNGRKLNYPIVMDVEDDSILRSTGSAQRRSEIILAFKEVVEDAGYDFALYANTTWLNNYLDMDMLRNVDIWVARWRPLDRGHGYNGKGNVTMWQYSNEGDISGISGRVDLNVSYKNY